MFRSSSPQPPPFEVEKKGKLVSKIYMLKLCPSNKPVTSDSIRSRETLVAAPYAATKVANWFKFNETRMLIGFN